MKSTIFTDAELEAMDNRLKGIGKDPSGLFSQRIRPKIIEILSIWFKEEPALKELIKPMKRGPRGFMSKSIVYSQSHPEPLQDLHFLIFVIPITFPFIQYLHFCFVINN